MRRLGLAVVPLQRAHRAFAIVALGVALGGLALVDHEAVGRAGVRQMARAELRSLGRLAGLRQPAMQPAGDALGVFVQQQGGPMWVTEAVTEAVDADPAFAVDTDSPHRLDAEVVHHGSAWALRLSLWRRGWAMRSPTPRRLHLSPWLPMVTAAVGAGIAFLTRRFGLALLVAGGLAQLLALSLAPLVGLPEPTVVQAWRHGPLGTAFVSTAHALPDSTVAVGVGVVVLCSILVAFDHRRSRRVGGALLVWGIGGAIGIVAWLEAGLRAGLLAFAATAVGATSLVAMIGLWVLFFVRRAAAR